MKENSSFQLAVYKRWLKRAAPLLFVLLKVLNQLRLQLWTCPLVYGWRGRCFMAKERCLGFPVLRREFFEKIGYEIDLKSPRTFNQKISWLKLQPITPFQVQAVDKARSKQLALAWAKKHGLLLYASQTLALVSSPSEIPWDSLPSRVVVKATHGSGAVHFVNHGDDPQALASLFQSWLRYPYGIYKHEWVYWPVPRRLLVEEWLDGGLDAGLVDYKFHMSRGRCLAIQVNEGFEIGRRTIAVLTKDWHPLDVRWIYPRPENTPLRPGNLNEMLRIAELFSVDFDYVRIDLYNLPRADGGFDIYFGEFTLFPGSGMSDIAPRSFDRWLGSQIVLSH